MFTMLSVLSMMAPITGNPDVLSIMTIIRGHSGASSGMITINSGVSYVMALITRSSIR